MYVYVSPFASICYSGQKCREKTCLITVELGDHFTYLSLSKHICTEKNKGFNTTDKVFYCNFAGKTWFGVDVTQEDIADNFEACVWEPAVVKSNAITGAVEAATLILSVDETIKNPKSGGNDPPGPLPGRGRKPRRDV